VSSITFEEFSSDNPKSKNKALLISATLSILFHGLLIHFYFDEKFSLLSDGSDSPVVNLELKLTQKEPTEKIQEAKSIESNPIESKPIESLPPEAKPQESSRVPFVAKEKPIKSLKPNATTKHSTKTTNSNIESKPKSSIQPNSKPKLDLLSIRESIGKQEVESTINDQSGTSQLVYFNPIFGESLEKQAQEEARTRRLNEVFQREKNNEKFEFNVVGSTRVVRVDGVCWEAPVQTSMEEDTRVWTRVGDCSVKDKLDFSKRKLDLEYKEGKREF